MGPILSDITNFIVHCFIALGHFKTTNNPKKKKCECTKHNWENLPVWQDTLCKGITTQSVSRGAQKRWYQARIDWKHWCCCVVSVVLYAVIGWFNTSTISLPRWCRGRWRKSRCTGSSPQRKSRVCPSIPATRSKRLRWSKPTDKLQLVQQFDSSTVKSLSLPVSSTQEHFHTNSRSKSGAP